MASKPEPKFKIGDTVKFIHNNYTFEVYHVTDCQKEFGYEASEDHQWAYGEKDAHPNTHKFEEFLEKATKLHKALM